jgi:thioredoxin-dependent peroxiredoxin
MNSQESSMTYPQIGLPAPEINLQDQHGNQVSLSDHKGKNIILYFYPKAMTPGCTVQACGLRDSQEELKKLDAVVLAVSPDSVKNLQKFVERDKLNFTLLSDPEHTAAELYGSWGMKKFMGREYMSVLRNTFIIDKEGVLRHIMDKVQTKTHHADAMHWMQENL